jgi:uncharacterized protein (TIGR01777 family)
MHWDGKTIGAWSEQLDEMDAIVNVTGYGLEHWPWTRRQKRRFFESRIFPGRLLASAALNSARRVKVFLQISGINYYGLRGDEVADEWTSAADDYLARLTVEWEAATKRVEEAGIRRIVARSGVVLDGRRGLLPLMALPFRLFLGGRLGDGEQAVAWIHRADEVGALRFLLENPKASGVYNLIAPTPTSNEQFMQARALAVGRPYWLRIPDFVLRAALGEMSVLVVDGRYSRPRRLLELGYTFEFPTIKAAFHSLFQKTEVPRSCL